MHALLLNRTTAADSPNGGDSVHARPHTWPIAIAVATGIIALAVGGCGGGSGVPADIARSERPTVRLDPADGACGARVTVLGGGFAGGDGSVVLALYPGAHDAAPADEPLRSFSVVRLRDDGSFRTTMKMGPQEVAADLCAPGAITLVATSGTLEASARYAVE